MRAKIVDIEPITPEGDGIGIWGVGLFCAGASQRHAVGPDFCVPAAIGFDAAVDSDAIPIEHALHDLFDLEAFANRFMRW